MFDIDIDLPASVKVEQIFPTAIRASRVQDEQLLPHPCGMFFENIPVDPITGLAAIPYDRAEELGYMKIDLLHLSFLNEFRDKQEVLDMLNAEPNWDLFNDQEVVEKLFQLRNSWDLVKQVKPKSIIELADIMAMIRPNKRKYVKQYLINPTKTRSLLYKQDENDKGSFRRSHAIAYASTVVIQMNKQFGRKVEEVNFDQQIEL